MTRAAEGRDDQARIRLFGAPGVGLTTLAVSVAYDLFDRYAAGHFYAELGGSVPGGRVDPDDAAQAFLVQLGAPEVPPGQRLAAFRQKTFDKRILMVLDDVADLQQVLDLLPTSPNAVVLITSKRRHQQRAGYPIEEIEVERLTDEDAMGMLVPSFGVERLAAEPEAARALLEACVGMPRALELVASLAALHPYWTLAELAEPLSAAIEQFEPLYVPYDLCFAALKPEHGAALLRLTLHEGPTLTRRLAAAMLGTSSTETRDILGQLTNACFVRQLDADTYRLQGLTGRYGRLRAATGLTEAQRRVVVEAAVRELLVWAVSRARAYSARPCVGEAFERVAPAYDGDTAARRAAEDLEDFWPNVRAAVLAAADVGLNEECVQLCQALSRWLYDTGRVSDLLVICRAAGEAARQLADPRFLLRMEQEQGMAWELDGNATAAIVHFQRAAAQAEALGDVAAQASAVEWEGIAAGGQGNHQLALERLADARALITASTGDLRTLALLHMHSGRILLASGRAAEALGQLDSAAEYFLGGPEMLNVARIRHLRGVALGELGRLAEAEAALEECRSELDPGRFGGYLIRVLESLGDVRAAVGRLESAFATWRAAYELATERLLAPERLRLARTLARQSEQAGDAAAAAHWQTEITKIQQATGVREG